MTHDARVRDLRALRDLRRDEPERVAPDVHVAEGLLDLRHVTAHALAARRSRGVVGVRLERRGARSVRPAGIVALRAHLARLGDEDGGVVGAVRVVAVRTGDAVAIHARLHEVVALHPVLVTGAVGEVRERGLAGPVLLEPPEVSQRQPDPEADRPVVGLARARLGQRAPLRVTLDAHVVRRDRIELRRIDDVGLARRAGMRRTRPVALLAAGRSTRSAASRARRSRPSDSRRRAGRSGARGCPGRRTRPTSPHHPARGTAARPRGSRPTARATGTGRRRRA